MPVLGLVVKDRRGLELIADDRERRVVGRASAGFERVGKCVARIRIGRRERADDGADGKVFSDRLPRDRNVRRRLIDVGDAHGHSLRDRERSIAHIHHKVVDVVNARIRWGFVIRCRLERQDARARVDREESLVSAAHDTVAQRGADIGIGSQDRLDGRLVFGDAHRRRRRDRRGLVDIRHRDREVLLREETERVGGPDPRQERTPRLVVENRGGLQLAAVDREVRRRAGSVANNRVRKRVARIRVGRGERADDCADGKVLRDAIARQRDVGGCLVGSDAYSQRYRHGTDGRGSTVLGGIDRGPGNDPRTARFDEPCGEPAGRSREAVQRHESKLVGGAETECCRVREARRRDAGPRRAIIDRVLPGTLKDGGSIGRDGDAGQRGRLTESIVRERIGEADDADLQLGRHPARVAASQHRAPRDH